MKTKDLVLVGLLSALIYLTVSFFKIPMGTQMVHLGNAMVVVIILVFGAKIGAFSSSLGLFLFDITHGYAAVAWITVLESLIICLILFIVYEKILSKNDKIQNIIAMAILAAVSKVIMNLIKYTYFYGMIGGGLTFEASLSAAIVKITGSYGSAILTAVAVPLFYPVMKKIQKIIYK